MLTDICAKFLEENNIKPHIEGGHEIHPTDWWASLSDEAKNEYEAQRRKRLAEANKKSKKPRGDSLQHKKTSLYDTTAPQEENVLPDSTSAVPTPGETSEREASETETDGQEQPKDKFGVFVPKKPGTRNLYLPENRIVVEPPFKFDEDEIGIRIHHVKRNNKNELTSAGMDPFPNPKKLFLDQRARYLNSTKNRPEDLDQVKVQEFGVHPIYGVPVKGDRNPDFEEGATQTFKGQTDWSEPLLPTQPIIFIQEVRGKNSLFDDEKKVFRTSRSTWMLQTERDFEEVASKSKMARVLESMGVREPRPKRPVTITKKPLEPQVIEPSLIQAASNALVEVNKPAAVFSPPVPAPLPPPPPSQRSHGYDPVRDTGYESRPPPTPPPPPPPPPAYSSLYPPLPSFPHPDGSLAVLADAAELRGSMAPPRAFGALPRSYFPTAQPQRQLNPLLPQQPRPPPPIFYNYGPPVLPQYIPPRRTSDGLRPLRPALPQNRGPPAPTQHRWYGYQ
jgi:hypothetical protein